MFILICAFLDYPPIPILLFANSSALAVSWSDDCFHVYQVD